MPNYGNFEQKFLDNLPKVATTLEAKLDLNRIALQPTINSSIDNQATINQDYLFLEDDNGGRGTAMQRVRTDGQPHSTEPPIPNNYFNNITNNNASSFVLIVFAVITLVILLSFLTFEILKYIGI